MFHLKIGIPSFRQVQSRSEKYLSNGADNNPNRGHFVYNIEVGFLGEKTPDVQERMARFYLVERRYSAFLNLHNEVCPF